MEGINKKLFSTIKMAQKALARWIVPYSTVTDREVIYDLL